MKSKLAQIAQSAQDLNESSESYFIKAFLAGSSGSGKTLSATTLPGRKLWIDFDGRSETLAGSADIDIIQCLEPDPRKAEAWKQAEKIRMQVLSEVKAGVFPYQSIIFDGATMLRRYCLNWALTLDPKHGLGGCPAQQHYLPEMDNIAKFIHSTLALKLNILYTGHLDIIEEEGTGKTLYLPKVTGKLRTEFPNWFDETYYCYRLFDSAEKKVNYFWQTAGTGSKEFFKSSMNKENLYWDNPISIDFSRPLVGFEDLKNRRFNPSSEVQAKVEAHRLVRAKAKAKLEAKIEAQRRSAKAKAKVEAKEKNLDENIEDAFE